MAKADSSSTAASRALTNRRSRSPLRWSPEVQTTSGSRASITSLTGRGKPAQGFKQLESGKGSESEGSHENEDEIKHFEWSPGQVLNEKYRLDSLCGDGTFGRVCLATDTCKQQQVAIKIIRNGEPHKSSAKIEAQILARINEADPWGEHRCCYLHEVFTHASGHFCIVLEPLGANLYEFLKANDFRGFWLQDIQIMSKQILRALSFLHDDLNLTHTDLKPENVLLTSLDPARISWFPRKDFCEALQRQADEPRCKTSRQRPYVRPRRIGVKLIDFGNAASDEDPHDILINTRQYRGPEVILGNGWGTKSDIWSAGCIFFELYTGEMLFATHESMEHLALMEQIIGPLPSRMTAGATRSVKFKLLKQVSSPGIGCWWSLNWPEGASCGASFDFVDSCVPLARHLQQRESDQTLGDLVGALCKLDPAERLTAKEAMKHGFFNSVPMDEDGQKS